MDPLPPGGHPIAHEETTDELANRLHLLQTRLRLELDAREQEEQEVAALKAKLKAIEVKQTISAICGRLVDLQVPHPQRSQHCAELFDAAHELSKKLGFRIASQLSLADLENIFRNMEHQLDKKAATLEERRWLQKLGSALTVLVCNLPHALRVQDDPPCARAAAP